MQSILSVDPMRTTKSRDKNEQRGKSRKSKRKSPKKTEDDFQRLMLGAISDEKISRTREPIISARKSEQYRPNATMTRNEQNLGGSMFDENVPEHR